jgi:glycosyltransferase involved in cell wall biosynthesis
MIKNKLSIIVPFAQEHPQAAFTVQALYCELRDRCDFEIIVIDNYCEELEFQLQKKNVQRDHGSEYLSSLANHQRPWLKYVAYNEKLSHWNAKNAGIAASDGEFLFFCDSHCVPSRDSLYNIFEYYKKYCEDINGTLHLPIAYMLEKPGLELIYKLVYDIERGIMHYSFTRYKPTLFRYSVPCMSTCGMIMNRSLYDMLGGWPAEMGIYGGGEHFINFTLATFGKTINIFPSTPLFHYAAPRGYHWNYNDYHRNRCIASYMFGGEKWAYRYIMNIKGDNSVNEAIYSTVVGSKKCISHKKHIEQYQAQSIGTWLQSQVGTLPDGMYELAQE